MSRIASLLTGLTILLWSVTAMASDPGNLQGAGPLKFGMKFDKCVELIGNVPRRMTVGNPGEAERKFSYAPAQWCGMDWEGSVLDFYKGKLCQIGFYKTTTANERTAFKTAADSISRRFGKPVAVQDTDNNLIWATANGNLILLQYVMEHDANGSVHYATYAILVDNKQAARKARKDQKFLEKLMK